MTHEVHPPGIDDGNLEAGRCSPAAWVMALAYLKARHAADSLQGKKEGLVLGADTVCVQAGQILGQPRDVDQARTMLRSMRGKSHNTLSGVCLLAIGKITFVAKRIIAFDRSEVRVGIISDDQIESYLASGQWRGKAGGYNLNERIEAGWSISCTGDPTTVMGLPMRRLPKWLGMMEGRAA